MHVFMSSFYTFLHLTILEIGAQAFDFPPNCWKWQSPNLSRVYFCNSISMKTRYEVGAGTECQHPRGAEGVQWLGW